MSSTGIFLFFFFNATATTEIYTYCHTLSLHDALPIYPVQKQRDPRRVPHAARLDQRKHGRPPRHGFKRRQQIDDPAVALRQIRPLAGVVLVPARTPPSPACQEVLGIHPPRAGRGAREPVFFGPHARATSAR